MVDIGGVTLSAGALATIASAAAIGGFLRGFVGFGGALALVPALALALGPRLAVGVASLVALPAVFQLLPEVMRYADRDRIGPVALAILMCTPLGSLILVNLDQRIMTGSIGALVMLMALATWRAPKKHIAERRWLNVVAGGFSGVLQGAAGIGGPPSVVVLMAQGGETSRIRGDVLAVTASIALCGGLSHWWFGVLTLNAGAIAVLILPLFIGFTWLGSRYFHYGGAKHFRAAALAVLMLIGFAAVAGALRQLL